MIPVNRFRCQLRCGVAVLVLLLCGCAGGSVDFVSVSDVDGTRIGIASSLPVDSVKERFPHSDVRQYDRFINLFMDFEGGSCDVALLDEYSAARVLSRNPEYAALDTLPLAGSMVYAIVPKARMLSPEEDDVSVVGWLEKQKSRLYRNFLDANARKLILGGLCTTVVIFVFGVVLAVALAVFLTYLYFSKRCVWLYRPLSRFVFTIHDVPSVVLMMFFYYVLFAASMNGIVVCIIALGVYTSGTLANIFRIHISQVGKEQLEAGRMLGLTSPQIYRYIILPQAVKTMLPLVAGEFKVLLRATSYAGYVAQKDLVKAVDTIREDTLDSFFPLLVVALLYLFLSWLIVRAAGYLYSKLFVHD